MGTRKANHWWEKKSISSAFHRTFICLKPKCFKGVKILPLVFWGGGFFTSGQIITTGQTCRIFHFLARRWVICPFRSAFFFFRFYVSWRHRQSAGTSPAKGAASVWPADGWCLRNPVGLSKRSPCQQNQKFRTRRGSNTHLTPEVDTDAVLAFGARAVAQGWLWSGLYLKPISWHVFFQDQKPARRRIRRKGASKQIATLQLYLLSSMLGWFVQYLSTECLWP